MIRPAARNRKLAAVHAAKRDLRLDDGDYRDTLERLTGARSAADLDDAHLDLVLDHFAQCGWRPPANKRQGARRPAADKQRFADRRAAGAGPQEALILALWDELADTGAFRGDAPRLETFMARVLGRPLSHPRFLAPADANKVVEGLKSWLKRARRAGEAAS